MNNALEKLTHYLTKKRQDILENWRLRAESDTRSSTPAALTVRQFEDHIPEVLDAFNRELLAAAQGQDPQLKQREKKKIAEHGLHRWQQGYHLEEVILDWGHLNLALSEYLETFSHEHSQADLSNARKCLAILVNDGMMESVRKYEQLKQTEAAGHVRELKRNLLALSQLSSNRAHELRQITHDLRGSLSIIDGTANMIGDDGLTEQEQATIVSALKAGISSLRTIFDDLILLARLDAGEEQLQVDRFDVSTELLHLARAFEPVAEQLDLNFYIKENQIEVVAADRTKALRIFQNLILNALKYTDAGSVTVSWGISELPNHWFLSVTDTGPGISLENETLAGAIEEGTIQDRAVREGDEALSGVIKEQVLEEESAAAKNNWASSEGVGLTIVKRLCELLDAIIEVDPNYSKGTRFVVHFPSSYR